MPKPSKKKKSKVPGSFKGESKGFAEFAIKQAGATKTPEFKGKPAPRIYRFPPFEKMTGLVAKEIGIPKRKMSKWSDQKRKNWNKRIRKVKELLSKTHWNERKIAKETGENREFIDAVDNIFNLRIVRGKRGPGVPQREIRLLRKAKKLAPFTSYVKIARRLGLKPREVSRINQVYNAFFGLSEREFLGFKEGISVHRLSKAVFRIDKLGQSLGKAAESEGFDRSYFWTKWHRSGKRFEKFMETIRKSPQYKNFIKRVKEKEKKGHSFPTAMGLVENEIRKKRNRINEKNLHRIRNGKLNQPEYKKGIKLVYHTMKFYWDFLKRPDGKPNKMPQDIAKKIKEFVEKNKDKLETSKLKEEKGKLKFVTSPKKKH